MASNHVDYPTKHHLVHMFTALEKFRELFEEFPHDVGVCSGSRNFIAADRYLCARKRPFNTAE
jgi:hypothetical protein